MSKPAPGKQYRVIEGDTVERIASIAYGDVGRSRDILMANPGVVVPGVVLNLPGELDFTPIITTPGLVLVIAGVELPTESLRFLESIETIADAWTGVIAWTPEALPKLDEVIRPYSYSPAEIFLDGELLGTGRLYVTTTGLRDRQDCALECWSLTADLVDSALAPPYEQNKVTLKQRVESLAKPFSLKVEVELDQDGVFDRVTASEQETAGAHLLSLTKQRGVLLSSTAKGALRLSVPAASGAPVATIEEGVEGFSGFEGSFDGRNRFSEYRVIGSTPFDEPNNLVVKDSNVPVARFLTKNMNETTAGELQQAAGWLKSKFLSEALSLPISARGFKRENGERWKKGDYVTLISPTLFIFKGFLMLVKSVEFLSDSSGDVSQLTLVPPSVYSGGDVVEPWAS